MDAPRAAEPGAAATRTAPGKSPIPTADRRAEPTAASAGSRPRLEGAGRRRAGALAILRPDPA